MTSCIFSYCCTIIILLLGSDTSANFSYEKQLYDGSQCTTEHGAPGICKKLPECLPRLIDVRTRRRIGNAVGRCGFDGHIEIVCCPMKLGRGLRARSAERTCQQMNVVSITKRSSIAIQRPYQDEKFADRGIVNGRNTSSELVSRGRHGRFRLSEFPYMAVLGYQNNRNEESGAGRRIEKNSIVYDCGGVLVSPKYILTAAHCVKNRADHRPQWVKLGSKQLGSDISKEVLINQTIPHPQYQLGKNYHDIALVESTEEFDITIFRPVCLQATVLSNFAIHSNTFVAIGIGATNLDDNQRSNYLMKTPNLTLVPVTSCTKLFPNFATIPEGIDNTMVCAKDPNPTRASGICNGDSGGPLLMITGKTHRVIAVATAGQRCHSVLPGVYTSVSAHINWIESTVWPEKTKPNKIYP